MNFQSLKISRLIILLFVISFILKLAIGLISLHFRSQDSVGDELCYIPYAEKIMEKGLWASDENNESEKIVGPGYPLILAALFSLLGKNHINIIFMNALIGALLTIVVFHLGKNVFNVKVGLIASFWTIVYVLYYRWITFAGKEMWLFLLLPLTIYLVFLEAGKKRFTARFVFLALLYGFFIHIDERFLFYLPLICLMFFLINQNSFKIPVLKAVVFTGIILVLMLPWTIRNYQVYGKIIILTTRTHRADIVLNKFSAKRLHKETIESKHYLTKEQIDSIANGLATYGRDPREIERIKRGVFPVKHSIFERWSAELFEFLTPCRFTPGYSGNGYRFQYRSTKHNIALLFSYGILLPFFLVGIIRVIKQKNTKGIIFLVIITVHTFVHVFLLWSVYRYRVPIDSFIIIIAAYGFQIAYFYIREKMIAFQRNVSTTNVIKLGENQSPGYYNNYL